MKALTACEMRIVYQARAESRVEATELELLKEQLEIAYFLREGYSESDFVRRWPEICSEEVRRRALAPRGDN